MQSICKACGKTFNTHQWKDYCKDCRYKHRHPEKEKICVVCGKTFLSGNTAKIYCGKKCSTAVWEKKMLMEKKITYFQIFKRDNFRCIYCGKSIFENNIKLVIDHIEPRKNGVDNNITNLVTACKECNASKSALSLSPEIIGEIKIQTLKRTIEHKLEYAELKDYFDSIYKK